MRTALRDSLALVFKLTAAVFWFILFPFGVIGDMMFRITGSSPHWREDAAILTVCLIAWAFTPLMMNSLLSLDAQKFIPSGSYGIGLVLFLLTYHMQKSDRLGLDFLHALVLGVFVASMR